MKKEEVTNKESEKCKRIKGTIIYIAFIAISITAIVLLILNTIILWRKQKT